MRSTTPGPKRRPAACAWRLDSRRSFRDSVRWQHPSVTIINVSEIHDTAQQERDTTLPLRVPLFIAGALPIAGALVIADAGCHCGLDPQSSGGAALDPGSSPGQALIRGRDQAVGLVHGAALLLFRGVLMGMDFDKTLSPVIAFRRRVPRPSLPTTALIFWLRSCISPSCECNFEPPRRLAIRHAAWPCSISWTRTLPVERQRLSAYQFPAPIRTADWPPARGDC